MPSDVPTVSEQMPIPASLACVRALIAGAYCLDTSVRRSPGHRCGCAALQHEARIRHKHNGPLVGEYLTPEQVQHADASTCFKLAGLRLQNASWDPESQRITVRLSFDWITDRRMCSVAAMD